MILILLLTWFQFVSFFLEWLFHDVSDVASEKEVSQVITKCSKDILQSELCFTFNVLWCFDGRKEELCSLYVILEDSMNWLLLKLVQYLPSHSC